VISGVLNGIGSNWKNMEVGFWWGKYYQWAIYSSEH